MIHIIAALGENNVIGKDNGIPWQIPADLAHFKALTMGHTIIMGRKTFESIGRVLPNRENIIVSATLSAVEGAHVVSSLHDALQIAANDEIFVIGGAQLYAEALPLAEQLDITHVHLAPEGDTYFPFVDWSQYEEVWRKEYDGSADYVPNCTFITYRKKENYDIL
jgi:dihydrofolate reductase